MTCWTLDLSTANLTSLSAAARAATPKPTPPRDPALPSAQTTGLPASQGAAQPNVSRKACRDEKSPTGYTQRAAGTQREALLSIWGVHVPNVPFTRKRSRSPLPPAASPPTLLRVLQQAVRHVMYT